MRPINADELREWLIRAGQFVKAQDDKRSAAHAIGRIIDHIDNMPTIDAIPVEWIRSKITGAKKDAGAVIHDVVLKELLFDWQKEKEAR